MPNQGMIMTKITQSVLIPPPMSLLRKISPRIQNRHMNHAKNRKNSNRASRNEPLLSNMRHLSGGRDAGCQRLREHPRAITGPAHHPFRVRRLRGNTDPAMRPVLARQMETWAGSMEQTDHRIGRIIDTLDEYAILDETLVVLIAGDNGASGEAALLRSLGRERGVE